MKKTKEETFDLTTASTELRICRDDLLILVMGENKPLGKLPYVPDHNIPERIRFTQRQIQFVRKKLKNYEPEPLDFEAVDKIFERLLK